MRTYDFTVQVEVDESKVPLGIVQGAIAALIERNLEPNLDACGIHGVYAHGGCAATPSVVPDVEGF